MDGVDANSGGIQSLQNPTVETSIADVGGTPYVVWREFDAPNDEIRVARLGGNSWSQPWVGQDANYGGLNVSTNAGASEPEIVSVGGTPYVTWHELAAGITQIRVSRLDAPTSGWAQPVPGAAPINASATAAANNPAIASVGGVPWVSWAENSATSKQTRVARLDPEFISQSATPTETGATLSTTLRTFGLPYAVGFQHGTALESETVAETVATGADTATVTQQVNGLAPSTAFQFRPFAEAGTPQPRVLGTTGTFTTLTPAEPDPEPEPSADDRAGPNLVLGGKRKQDLARKVVVKATCTDEPCALEATGRLTFKVSGGKRARKGVALGPAAADAVAGETAKLSLKLAKRSFKLAHGALGENGRAKAKLTVIATDGAGNSTGAKRKVNVRAG